MTPAFRNIYGEHQARVRNIRHESAVEPLATSLSRRVSRVESLASSLSRRVSRVEFRYVPHLFRRPFSSTTIFPERWLSTNSNSPMYPCFIITCRNLMTTLEDGRIKTCFFPLFSALYMLLRASPRTEMRTMVDISAVDERCQLVSRYSGPYTVKRVPPSRARGTGPLQRAAGAPRGVAHARGFESSRRIAVPILFAPSTASL